MSVPSIPEGVCYFDRPGALNLEFILHGRSRGDTVRAKTGAWIVHFDLPDGFSRLVLDLGVDPFTVPWAPASGYEKRKREPSDGPPAASKDLQLLPSSPSGTVVAAPGS